MAALSWDLQLLNILAALLLLLSFAMLSQRRIVALVNLLGAAGDTVFARDAAAGVAHGRYQLVFVRGAHARA